VITKKLFFLRAQGSQQKAELQLIGVPVVGGLIMIGKNMLAKTLSFEIPTKFGIFTMHVALRLRRRSQTLRTRSSPTFSDLVLQT
jgi:hypothetical protein